MSKKPTDFQSIRDELIHAGSTTPLTPDEKIQIFKNLFRGRDDVYPKLWINNNTGKKGYSPACAKEWVRGVCEKPSLLPSDPDPF